ncbi:MAG TPA: hypothetical protein PLH11_07115 [Gemmobacter sp.]|nr:hypothetical protein [Gemmobacter sp.]
MKYALLCVSMFFAATSAMAADMNKDQLLQLATDRKTCGEAQPVDAYYDPPGGKVVKVVCSEKAAGFIPAVGGLGALGAGGAAVAGLALVASAAGGGSTPSTN